MPSYGYKRLTFDEQDGVSMGQTGPIRLTKNNPYAKGEFCAIEIMVPAGLNTVGVTAKSNIGQDLALNGVFSITNPSFYETANAGNMIWGNFSEVLMKTTTGDITDFNLWLYPVSNSFPLPNTLTNNHSLYFDGSSDHLELSSPYATVFDGSFTISCWFKFDDGRPSTSEYIFGAHNGDNDWISLATSSSGKLYFGYNSGGSTEYARSAGAVIADGETGWHHIVCVLDAPEEEMLMYLDGESVSISSTNGYNGDTTGLTISNFDSDENLYVGARNNNGGMAGAIAGYVDEFTIWDKAFSLYEVQRYLSDYGWNGVDTIRPMSPLLHPSASTNLQGWFRMGDGTENASGSTIYDESTNSNNATMEHDTTFTTETP